MALGHCYGVGESQIGITNRFNEYGEYTSSETGRLAGINCPLLDKRTLPFFHNLGDLEPQLKGSLTKCLAALHDPGEKIEASKGA